MIDNLVVGAIATNCWIVKTADEEVPGRRSPCVVVDPGGDGDAIIARLERLKLRPTRIVLTHGHFDHVAALAGVFKACAADGGPEPVVAVHTADASYLGPASKAAHLRDFRAAGAAQYVEQLWEPLPPPARFLAEGDLFGPFRVIHTPGHTPGSICLHHEKSGFLLSGDTLFAGGVGRTDLFGGSWDQLEKSLTRLYALDGGLRVLPGHGGETRIGRERP